ncbi:toxin glutamine deamidase domain-containing protein [Streptomyces sp. NPDC056224]|uniref:toxin glutamine deamidase domain-containing protein n=1 Tax=Streptomyces sp. NPDC056224 TaxID=3345750 RepID=UPI0035E2CC9F
MAIQVPKDIVPFMEVLTGMKMPDGNEDKMFLLAQVHHELRQRLEALPQILNDCVKYTASSFTGPAAKQYRDAMAPFIDGSGIDYIKTMSGQAAMIAEFTSEAATQIQYVKYMIIAQCIELLLEMAIALALAFITGGASILEYLAGEAVATFFMQNMIARVIGMLVMHEVISMGMGAAMDSMVQWIQLLEGTRDKFDTESTIQAVKFGAIQGLISLPMAHLGGLFGKGLGNLFGKNAKKDITNIITNAGGNKALGKDLGDVLGGALTRGNGPLSEAARNALVKDVGKAFADNVGTSAERALAREAGEKWAKELLDNFGKAGLPKALRGTLDSLEGVISADLMKALTKGLPDNLARDLLRSFGNHLGMAVTDGVTQVLAEGTYNAIFSDQHNFESTWLTFGSGVVGGRLGHLANAGGEHLGLKLHEKAFGAPPEANAAPPKAGSGAGASTTESVAEGGTSTTAEASSTEAESETNLSELVIDEVTDSDWEAYWGAADEETETSNTPSTEDHSTTAEGAPEAPTPVVTAPAPVVTASAPPASAPAPAPVTAGASAGGARPATASTPGSGTTENRNTTPSEASPRKVATSDTSTAPEATAPVRPATESETGSETGSETRSETGSETGSDEHSDTGPDSDGTAPVRPATESATETEPGPGTGSDAHSDTASDGEGLQHLVVDPDPSPVATASSAGSLLGAAPEFTASTTAAPPPPARTPLTNTGRWQIADGNQSFVPHTESANVRLITPQGDVIGLTPRSAEQWLVDSGIEVKSGGIVNALDGFLYRADSTQHVYAQGDAARFRRDLAEWSTTTHTHEQGMVLEAVSELAGKIKEKYPPEDNVYLGLGRSPAAVIAALQVAGVTASSMPLSDFRPGPSDFTSIHYAASIPAVGDPSPPPTIRQREMLFEHFKEFVPELPPGKDLVLIDYTQSGRSLFAAEGLLGEYFTSIGRDDVTVKAFAIHQDIDGRNIKGTYDKIARPRGVFEFDAYVNTVARKEWAKNVELFSLPPVGLERNKESLVGDAFKNEAFDGIAEFDSYKLLSADPERFEAERPRRADGESSDGYHDVLKRAIDKTLVATETDTTSTTTRPTHTPTTGPTHTPTTSSDDGLLGAAPPPVRPGDPRMVFNDPAHEQAQAQMLARDYPWLGDVNPYRDSIEEARTNCLLTAIATDLSLAEGEGHQAPPSELSPAEHLANYRDRPPVTVRSYENLTATLQAAGPGARGMVVVGSGGERVAHVFNVVHDANGIVFLDGQTGRLADLPPGPDRLEFLATHGEFGPETGPSAETGPLGGKNGTGSWTEKLPDPGQWVDTSSRRMSGRSPDLVAIDRALTEHHAADPAQHLNTLGTLQQAIEGWQTSKRAFVGADVDNPRAGAVADLLRSVDEERLRLTEASRGRVEGYGKALPSVAYDRVAVYSAGAMTETDGSFTGDSAALHEAARRRLSATMPTRPTEVDIRIEMLSGRVEQAYAEFDAHRQGQEEGLLGVVTAPEWFFKRPEIPFTRGEKEMITTAMVELSARHPGLLIVPGSTVWSEPNGTGTVLKAGTSVVLNGRLVHETTKVGEGSDVVGYGPNKDVRATLSESDRAAAEQLNEARRNDFVAAGRSVTDKALFTVGNRTIALEICLDHHNKRALAEWEEGRPKADIQIVVAHGMALKNSVLTEGGIAVFNDGNELPGADGALREVHVMDDNTRFGAATLRAKLKTRSEINTLGMGVYPLPESRTTTTAAPDTLLGTAWSMSTLSSELPSSLADDAFRAIMGDSDRTTGSDRPGGGLRRPHTPDLDEPNPAKRPYTDAPQGDRGLTGRGLLPPTPEQHQAVIDHVASLDAQGNRPPDVTPELLRYIDPSGSRTNCLEANLALWDTLDGHPRAAGTLPEAQTERRAVWELSKSEGPAWHYGRGPQAVEQVVSLVRAGGPGSRGVLLVAEDGRIGHAVTVLHGSDGRLQLVDPQQHTVRDIPDSGPDLRLLPGGDGSQQNVWAHVRDGGGELLRGDGRYDESLYHDRDTGGPAHEFGMLPGGEGEGLQRIFDRRPVVGLPGWGEIASRFETDVAAHAYKLSRGTGPDLDVGSPVTRALAKLSTVLDAFHGPAPDTETALKPFLKNDAGSAGQIAHSDLVPIETLTMLTQGNPREKFTAFYNAAYYAAGNSNTPEVRDFKKVLLGIMQSKDWAKARDLGLDDAALKSYSEHLFSSTQKALHAAVSTASPGQAHLFAQDPFALGNLISFKDGLFGDLVEMTLSQIYRKARPELDQHWGAGKLTPTHLRAREAELSARELRFLSEHQELTRGLGVTMVALDLANVHLLPDGLPDVERIRAENSTADRPVIDVKYRAERDPEMPGTLDSHYTVQEVQLLFEEKVQTTSRSADLPPGAEGPEFPLRSTGGEAYYSLDPDSQWTRDMAGRGHPVIAGLSGTTTRMLSAFSWLNVDGTTQADFVVGLIGWMRLHNDHSLYEILRGADMAGFEGTGGRTFDLTDAASMYRSLTALGPEFDMAALRDIAGGQLKMLPHERVYYEHALDDGFKALGADERRLAKDVMEAMELEKNALGSSGNDVLHNWLTAHGITTPDRFAQLATDFTEAHALALVAYTGPNHQLINLAIERNLSADGKLPVVDTFALAARHVLDGMVEKALANEALEPPTLFFDAVVDAQLVAYDNATAAADTVAADAAKAEINRLLDERMPDIVKEAKLHADMAAEALRVLPGTSTGTLYRGDWAAGNESTPAGVLGMLPLTYSGDTITTKSLASTSFDEDVALGFAPDKPMAHRVLLEITPNGNNGRSIAPFSQMAGEEEVLYMPGATFRVISRAWTDKLVSENGNPPVMKRYEVITVVEE